MMKKIQGKLTLTIHRVHLHVKFPCSLSTQLKIQNEEIPIGQEVPLRLDQALLQASVELGLETIYNSQLQRFDQKKVSIQVYLNTMSGRVPAGIAHFDLKQIKKGTNMMKLTVERCPDKEARITLSVHFDGWNQIPGFYQVQETEQKYSEKVIGDLNNLRENGYSRVSSLVQRQPEQFRQQDEFIPKLPIGKQDNSQLTGYNEQHGEKSAYRLNMNKSSPLQDSTRAKTMDKDREYKNLQRKYEQQMLQLKGITAKKQLSQRNLKDSDQQIKSIKQKYEDLRITNESLTRRMEFTQHSLKEQLKNISIKLTSAETEKQKLIYEKNQMINRFEEREKTVRELLREKEKAHSQEKINNSKKIETINSQFEEYRSRSSQLQVRVKELQRELEAQKLTKKRRQQQKTRMQQQISQFKQQLLRQRNERKRLQEEQNSSTKFEDEKKKFKRRLNELEQELAKQNKNLMIAESNYQRQVVKSEDLDNKLKQQQLSTKSERKQNEKLRKQIDQLTQQLKMVHEKTQSQRQDKTQQNEKLNKQLRNQEEIIKKADETRKNLLNQIEERDGILISLKQRLENGSDELNQLQKCNIELQQNFEKLQQDHEKLRIVHQETLNTKQVLESQKIQMEIQLQSFIKELEDKEQEFKNKFSQQQSSKAEFERKVRQLQSKLSQSNVESASQIETLTARVQQLTRQSSTKSQELQMLQKYVEELQRDKTSGLAERSLLQESITYKNQQIQTLKQEIQKLNQQNERLQSQVQNLQIKLKQAYQHGSGNQQKLQQYKTKNNQDLSNFLKSIHGGIIQFQPEHQEQQIVELMRQVIAINNRYIQSKQQTIKHLHNQFYQLQRLNNQYTSEIEQKTNQIHCLSDALNNHQQRKNQLQKESSLVIVELKQENKVLKNNYQTLNQQFEQTESIYRQTSNQLQSATLKLDEEIKINSGLVSKMAIMQQNFNHQLQNLLKNSSSQGDRLTQEIKILQENLRAKEEQLQSKNNRCSDLGQQIAKLTRELEEFNNKHNSQVAYLTSQMGQLKQTIQSLQENQGNLKQQNESYRKQSEQQISRLNKITSDLTDTKTQLEEKIVNLSKSGEMKQRVYQTETEYLKPIRQNLTYLRGYMNEYSRVGDQFESNKNKLLKMATVKLQQYNDRNVAQKVREVNLAFQKLKASIFGNAQMSEQQKLNMSEQMKKVQLTLDRALRGDR